MVPVLLGWMLLAGVPAFAQIDFTGLWTANTNWEDGPERVQGPSLVEFVGLPINDQARQWGLAYRSSRLSLMEHQCQVHVVSYIHRGPFSARVWEERDPVTHQLIAIHNFNPFYLCEYVEEGEHPRGEVPFYAANENPWVAQYAAEHNLPQEATLGGAETIYPEYRRRLKALPLTVFTPLDEIPSGARPAPPTGQAR